MNKSDYHSWGFWKITSVIMIILNIILMFLLLWQFNLITGIRDIAGTIDSTVVFSLTLLQSIIALGAFFGFWMIKNSAENKAIEAAQKVAKDVANERMTKFEQQKADGAKTVDNIQSAIIKPKKPVGVEPAHKEE